MAYKFVALDVETANASRASICQIGMIEFVDNIIVSEHNWLIDPEEEFDSRNIEIHGISPLDVIGKPKFNEIYDDLVDVIENQIVIHHGSFDRTAFKRAYEKYNLSTVVSDWIDNTIIVRNTWPQFKKKGYGLKNLTEHFNVELNHHDALSDAKAAGLISILAFQESNTQPIDWIDFRPTAGEKHIDDISKDDINSTGPFVGQTILFTGRGHLSRKELALSANALGFNVVKHASKKVDVLSIGDQDHLRIKGKSKSSKHLKIEELILEGYPIEIIMDDDLAQLFKNYFPTT